MLVFQFRRRQLLHRSSNSQLTSLQKLCIKSPSTGIEIFPMMARQLPEFAVDDSPATPFGTFGWCEVWNGTPSIPLSGLVNCQSKHEQHLSTTEWTSIVDYEFTATSEIHSWNNHHGQRVKSNIACSSWMVTRTISSCLICNFVLHRIGIL